MTRILAMDTATDACSVALYDNGTLYSHFEIAPRQHAALILPMIDSLLKEHAYSLENIDAYAFTQGPGGFMGLRIATGIVQGLAFATHTPIIPISTLQALAQTAYWTSQHTAILAGWDARMEGIYWGGYVLKSEVMEIIIPDTLSLATDFTPPSDAYDWKSAGNAWSAYKIPISGALINAHPTAKAAAFLAAKRYRGGTLLSAEEAQPVYLRNQVATAKQNKA